METDGITRLYYYHFNPAREEGDESGEVSEAYPFNRHEHGTGPLSPVIADRVRGNVDLHFVSVRSNHGYFDFCGYQPTDGDDSRLDFSGSSAMYWSCRFAGSNISSGLFIPGQTKIYTTSDLRNKHYEDLVRVVEDVTRMSGLTITIS